MATKFTSGAKFDGGTIFFFEFPLGQGEEKLYENLHLRTEES